MRFRWVVGQGHRQGSDPNNLRGANCIVLQVEQLSWMSNIAEMGNFQFYGKALSLRLRDGRKLIKQGGESIEPI